MVSSFFFSSGTRSLHTSAFFIFAVLLAVMATDVATRNNSDIISILPTLPRHSAQRGK